MENVAEVFNQKMVHMLNAQRCFLASIQHGHPTPNNPIFKDAFDQAWAMNQEIADFLQSTDGLMSLADIKAQASIEVDMAGHVALEDIYAGTAPRVEPLR
jgi:hypothetical protein